jgi:hypothetical protein
VHRNMVLTMALVMVLLGIAIIIRTLAQGSFGVGVVLGVLFVAAGGGRYWILRGRAR